MILEDRVILKPVPLYLPKLSSKFQRSQEVVLITQLLQGLRHLRLPLIGGLEMLLF